MRKRTIQIRFRRSEGNRGIWNIKIRLLATLSLIAVNSHPYLQKKSHQPTVLGGGGDRPICVIGWCYGPKCPLPLDPPVSPSLQHDRSEIREANYVDEKERY